MPAFHLPTPLIPRPKAEDIEPVPELALEDDILDEPACPLEPELEWEDSVCGEIERRILEKVMGE